MLSLRTSGAAQTLCVSEILQRKLKNEIHMNADVVREMAEATLMGEMPFPKIVGNLIREGVEYYHVDYISGSFLL